MERIAPISDSSDNVAAREQGAAFIPKFDSAGLLTAIAQDSASGEILMVAFMDRAALEATRATGFAHFHSYSGAKHGFTNPAPTENPATAYDASADRQSWAAMLELFDEVFG